MALLGVALLTALVVWALMQPAAQVPLLLTRFTIVPPSGQALAVSGTARDIALSRDGTYLVYVAGRGQLMVRPIERLEARPVPGVTSARSPFLSPDGRWIGFFTGVSGELRKVSVTGEPPISICRIVGVARGPSWSGDDTIVFATNEPTTGRTQPVLQTPFAERNAQISPDGHWLAYESNESGQEEIYVRPFPNVRDGRWQISIGGGLAVFLAHIIHIIGPDPRYVPRPV